MKKNVFIYMVMVLAMITLISLFGIGMQVIGNSDFLMYEAEEWIEYSILIGYITVVYVTIKYVWNKMKETFIK